jgi:4'-phosphopantetheinyl transferase EntD
MNTIWFVPDFDSEVQRVNDHEHIRKMEMEITESKRRSEFVNGNILSNHVLETLVLLDVPVITISVLLENAGTVSFSCHLSIKFQCFL